MRLIGFLIKLITAFLIPFALIFLSIRVLLLPAFLSLEYRIPGFPKDNYGFSLEERLLYSNLAVEYLINDTDINFLADLEFTDGEPLFNDRELSHMLDVKNVLIPTNIIGFSDWILLGLIFLLSIRTNQLNQFRRGLQFGAWILLGFISVIGLFSLISFWNFFSIFHSIFFEGESWIFLYSDTLIRLFPLRFWQDAFILAGLITIGGCLLILKLVKTKSVIT